jgi:hypothetical protein
MIIDFHTHVFPENLAKKATTLLSERSKVSSYTDGTLKGLLQSMERAAIDISVVAGIATKPEQVEGINYWHSVIRQPKISPLATIHPDLVNNKDLVKELNLGGFKGFKLHPDYQHFFVDEKRMYPFYEKVEAQGMFILFHAGVDIGLPPPVHATPKRLAKVHRDFPKLIIIAAHMGGYKMYEEVEEVLLGKDIYLDTSFALSKMSLSLSKRFFNKHSHERFLFGTDSPWTDQKEELEFFLSLPYLNEEGKQKILGKNPSYLLGLT